MHRRRTKSSPPRESREPKREESHGQGHLGTGRSRRRPKPGAHVPPQLRLPPEKEREILQPNRGQTTFSGPETGRKRGLTPGSAERKAEPVVLVTGFEPFGGEKTNPSWDLCARLPKAIAGARIEALRVPCAFGRAIEVVEEAIERLSPVLVVSLGQAGGRSHIGVERIAINIDDARAPDNAGNKPVDRPIAKDGPPAYFATLPVKAMVEAMHAARVPAEVSNSAGTYVCNHLMYGVLHALRSRGAATRAGFIHVPYAEEQVLGKPGVAALSVETMARGIEAAIAAALGT